jgi:hypothetical protein
VVSISLKQYTDQLFQVNHFLLPFVIMFIIVVNNEVIV